MPSRFLNHVLVFVLLGSAVLCHAQEPAPATPPVPELKDRAAPAAPKTASRSILSSDEYEHLLNIVFPMDHATPPGLDYTMVLRFEPHLHPEVQVVIRRFHDKHVEATLYRVTKGNAWRAAYGHDDPGHSPDFTAIAKEVEVFKNNFSLTGEQLEKWHAELFPALEREFGRVRTQSRQIAKSGTREVMVNGTRYELWYIQADDEIHVISWDHEVEALPSGSFDLTKWMNSVRWHANGHALGKTPPPAIAAK